MRLLLAWWRRGGSNPIRRGDSSQLVPTFAPGHLPTMISARARSGLSASCSIAPDLPQV